MSAPRGLPGRLPPGERLLWQGAPDAAALARSAFHTRQVALYFAGLTALALGLALVHGQMPRAAIATALAGAVAVGLLHLMGVLAARTTTYTLTDRRIVLRVGMALPKSINLPLGRIAAVDLSERGDIALRLTDTPPLGWLALWPHARPWRLARPEPMLRTLPEAETVARMIARAALALQPEPLRIAAVREPAVAAEPQACAA